jgi:hypothetical protein
MHAHQTVQDFRTHSPGHAAHAVALAVVEAPLDATTRWSRNRPGRTARLALSACGPGCATGGVRRMPQSTHCVLLNGARSRNRTGTTLRSADFKSDASTSFAIRAGRQVRRLAGSSRCAHRFDPLPHACGADRRGGQTADCTSAYASNEKGPVSRALIVKPALPASNWSGIRDSNSRPQPWQGCALPTELIPHVTLENSANRTFSDVWRPGSESNRRTRICSPLHDHSATRPVTRGWSFDLPTKTKPLAGVSFTPLKQASLQARLKLGAG